MRVKLTVVKDAVTKLDVLIDAASDATVADVAQHLAGTPELGLDPAGQYTLQALLPGTDTWTLLPPDAVIEDRWLTPASHVALYRITGNRNSLPSTHAGTSATLRILNGDQAGQVFHLGPGSHIVGRGGECEVRITDRYMSKEHFRVDVGSEVDVVDLGSANGLELGGRIVSRLHVVRREQFLAGNTEMVVEASERAAVSRQDATGLIGVKRSPRVESRYAGSTFKTPQVPKEPDPQPFPLLAMITPVLLGTAMFLMTGRATTLLFIAMSPIMLLGNYFTQRKRDQRKLEKSIRKFDDSIAQLESQMAHEQVAEHRARVAEIPASQEVLAASANLSPLLWTRRAEHWNFLDLCLGRGAMPSRNTIEPPEGEDLQIEYQQRVDALVDRTKYVADVPLVASWMESGAIGVGGRETKAVAVINAMLVQITGLHSPAEVAVVGLLSPEWARNLDWLKWLPHTASPHSPLSGNHLAGDQASCTDLLERLEELVNSRHLALKSANNEVRSAINPDNAAWHGGARVGLEGTPNFYSSFLPAVVVIISDDALVDRSRLVALSERAADVGVFPLWIADTCAALPAVCRAYIDADADQVGLVRLGEAVAPVALDLVDIPTATQHGRHLGRLVDADVPVSGDAGLPNSVDLVGQIDPELLSKPEAALERWSQNDSINDRSGVSARRRRPGKLRAIVGAGSEGALHLDLRTQGPHALVGGTTGSGKSEFLQAWVLGMAAEYSPDRVTFLFVDYKGGAAFAECVDLPHCVGIVTDLSPHLVRRALTSLRAELQHREHILHAKGAKDLNELEMRGDPDAPPSLVIVIDEFAALVGEVPEFVDGVVDVAQRGRSLGVHLIMATQRPAGVIKDNLRANTNLRVALRMADETDSSDVIGDQIAAHFDAGTPGRAVAKTGPGRLTMFQAGYTGGWSLDTNRKPEVSVYALPFGVGAKWRSRESDTALAPAEQDLGPTDQQRMVAVLGTAARQARIPAPRRPWLNELDPIYPLQSLPVSRGAGLPVGLFDEPERQRQSVALFNPDADGHMAVFGTGGSGKTVVLRTLAAAAASDPAGVTHIYGLDFASGGLRLLEPLPQVGAVVMGDDDDRVVRLMRYLSSEVEDRTRRFAAVGAASLPEYRAAAMGNPNEPRILLLVDSFGAFVDQWDVPAGGRGRWFRVLVDLVQAGRPLGIHVVFTADRPGAVPSAVRASVQRRLVLRMADENSYAQLDAPTDVLDENSPAGRGIWGKHEIQTAIFGADASTAAQAEAISVLAAESSARGVSRAPGIGSLPEQVALADLGASPSSELLLGIGDEALQPVGINREGTFVIAGPPQSGRSTLALTLATQAVAAGMDVYHVGPRRSRIAALPGVVLSANTAESVAEFSRLLSDQVVGREAGTVALIIEQVGDFSGTSAEMPLVELIKALKRGEQLVVGEGENSTWSGMSMMLNEIKSGRRGVLLQPESADGFSVLRTEIGRANRAEFPVGRGVLVASGKVERVQFALP